MVECKGNELRSIAANQLFDGAVSVEDKSERTGTVRPHLDERCEKRREWDSVLKPQFGECCENQSECDGVLSVKSGGNEIEINGGQDGRRGHGGRGDGI